MSRRKIDKETARRRAAAPSINFSLLPSSPDLQAMLDDAGLSDELTEEAPPVRASTSHPEPAHAEPPPPLPPEPTATSSTQQAQPSRSPHRVRHADGRTVQPFELPPPATSTPPALAEQAAEPRAQSAPAASAPPPPPPRRRPLKQSDIPTLQLKLDAQGVPLPHEPDDTLDPLPRAPSPQARGSGPTLALPADAQEPALDDPLVRSQAGRTPPDLSEVPPRDLSSEPLGPTGQAARRPHRAVLPSETPPGAPPPQGARRRSPIEPRAPSADKFSTVVSPPPDQAFYIDNAAIDESEISPEIDEWERRRWLRKLTAFALVAALIAFFTVIAVAGFTALYLESVSDSLGPPPSAPAQSP
ncbi:MAG: hypothetical protein EA397_07180 [Deltaproteobacteria bacterium]|nr:MAG: hypothetical protein EA397_07180 [Deltaproteobacteria bacterium]